MRYILNSAVITAPGVYEYRLIDAQTANDWLKDGHFESTVGYPETAQALQALTGVSIPVNKTAIQMQPGEEALVFRLVFPPGTPRIAQGDKGHLTTAYVREHSEIGLLRRKNEE